MITTTERKSKSNKMYALSDIRYAVKGFVNGEEKVLKTDFGFLMVFKTKAEAKRHMSEKSQILEIIIA